MANLQRPGPAVFVLYGATGDLAKRMVLPAFYELAKLDLLPEQWRLIGSGRGDVAHEDFAGHIKQSVAQFGSKVSNKVWSGFKPNVRFAGGDFAHDGHDALRNEIAAAREEIGEDSELIHYLAVPPQAFIDLTTAIGQHQLNTHARVVYEKPFGTSRESFRKLDRVAHRVFQESQIYRIDHFLGKEATQDLHVLRFANGMFSRIWDRHSVRAVQIDVPETLDVADRADFYDHTGAVLDMLVTHLFQVAAEIAMEPPASMSPDDLQAARESVIGKFRPIDPADVVLGQFDGYRDIDGIASGSRTETYVAARLWVDTPRWKGVPFLLRTGKRMHETHQLVSLILNEPAGPLTGLPVDGNVLQFGLDGSGEIELSMVAKQPGVGLKLGTSRATIPVSSIGKQEPLPPYVRLLHDVLSGDRSLVTRPDGLAHVWKVADPVLSLNRKPLPYPQDSWGPKAARKLAAPDGWLLGQ
jgi:glucose-6-phosphate 1-dehydrogenase